MNSPTRALLPLVLAFTACVGPDLGYAEVRTFEVERLDVVPYRIAEGDGLEIKFTYHPERNTAVTVRPDGKLSIPLAEEVQAAGLTVEELDAEITNKVDEHLNDSDLTVVVAMVAQERVFLAGEVRNPGEIRLIPGMSLHQALASVGWLTPDAADDSIVVIRTLEPGKRQAVRIDCSENALIAADLQLQRFDIVYVPQTTIARFGEWVDNYLNKTTPRWLQTIGTVSVIRNTN